MLNAYKIKLDGPPIGYAANTALEGEKAAVQIRGFLCSDEPVALLNVLESFSSIGLGVSSTRGALSTGPDPPCGCRYSS